MSRPRHQVSKIIFEINHSDDVHEFLEDNGYYLINEEFLRSLTPAAKKRMRISDVSIRLMSKPFYDENKVEIDKQGFKRIEGDNVVGVHYYEGRFRFDKEGTTRYEIEDGEPRAKRATQTFDTKVRGLPEVNSVDDFLVLLEDNINKIHDLNSMFERLYMKPDAIDDDENEEQEVEDAQDDSADVTEAEDFDSDEELDGNIEEDVVSEKSAIEDASTEESGDALSDEELEFLAGGGADSHLSDEEQLELQKKRTART